MPPKSGSLPRPEAPPSRTCLDAPDEGALPPEKAGGVALACDGARPQASSPFAAAEAERRLQQYGKNELEEKVKSKLR